MDGFLFLGCRKRRVVHTIRALCTGWRRDWGGIDMTIDPEELETILEDLDFMVEIVRQNCGTVSFLSVAHSAHNIRQLLKSVTTETSNEA